MTEKALADEQERTQLIMQAIREHQSNAEVELRRFQAALDNIENVYKLRKGGT